MPPIVRGSYSSNISDLNASLRGKDLGYKYPYDIDLRPGTEFHDKLVSKIMEMAEDSYNVMRKRHPTWNSLDEIMTAYIPTSEYEKNIKKKDKTKPVSIVVPYSYAALETILSYNTKAFLSGPNLFQYEGHGPEDTVATKLLELVIGQQTHSFKSALDVHTGYRDGLNYGFHASAVEWAEHWGKKPIVQQVPQFSSMGTLLGIKNEKQNVPALLFEGNKIVTIDSYKCLPDPNVSIHKVQDGEFFGWFEDVTLNSLLSREANGEGLFNVKYLREQGNSNPRRSKFSVDESKREKDGTSKEQTVTTNYRTVIYMYITIVPREWKLPGDPNFNKDGEYPEKWTFMIGDDTILLQCAPLGLNHDRYPVAVNSPDYDGYSIAPVSRMEMSFGLQEVLNWTFNSHIANVRKAINDMFVVDPSLISMTDLQNPEPGKLLRLRRSAWGRGVDQAIKQLSVTDITQRNITDASFVMDMMSKVNATPDASMGVMRGGSERRSAAEFSGTFGSGISRLEHLAKITSLMYMHDLAYLHASQTQQLMSQETYVRAAGEWPNELLSQFGVDGVMPSRVSASPYDIIADFDVVVKDGSDQSTDPAVLNFWSNMFPNILNNPMLFQVYDIGRIFKRIATLAGEKNVSDFVLKGGDIKAKLIGEETLKAEVERGNLVKAGAE